jgi:acetyl esterase/lipase
MSQVLQKVMSAFAFLAILAFATPHVHAQATPPAVTRAPANMRSVLLWPDGAPGALTGGGALDTPTLDIYVAPSNPTQTGVIVCPGGGYRSLSLIHEGSDEAAWLNAHGVTAFVLHYRLGPRYHYPAQFYDISRAVRYVRANAAELGIDPKHVGVWGFSAGGNLAAMISTHYDAGNPASADPIEQVGSRPDFTILCYAKITFHINPPNEQALLNLLGPNPDPKLVDLLSDEDHVTADTPPAFIYQTANDASVAAMNAILYFEAMQKAGAPAELHIFENGPHGTFLGTNFAGPPIPALAEYPTLLANWMRAHGLMQANPPMGAAAGAKP